MRCCKARQQKGHLLCDLFVLCPALSRSLSLSRSPCVMSRELTSSDVKARHWQLLPLPLHLSGVPARASVQRSSLGGSISRSAFTELLLRNLG